MPARATSVPTPHLDPRPHRWSLALRGVLAIGAALLLLALPAAGLVVIVFVFAALCAVDGAVAIVTGLAHLHSDRRWWAAVIQGLVSLALAAFAVWWPGVTLLALVWLAAAWAIWQGVTDVMVSRAASHGRAWLAFAGVLSVLLGLAMLVLPGLGAYGLVGLVAAYVFIRGATLLAASSRTRPPAV